MLRLHRVIVVAPLLLATAVFAQDVTYNGLYSSLVCIPRDGVMLACGPEYCTQMRARPVDSFCLSMTAHTVFEDAYDNPERNHLDQKPWKNAGTFEVQGVAKPELNRPLYAKLRISDTNILILMQPQGLITFSSSATIPEQKNEQYFGNTVFNRLIVAGQCVVRYPNYCENNSR